MLFHALFLTWSKMLVSPGEELLHMFCAQVFCDFCSRDNFWLPGSGGQCSLHFGVPWDCNRERVFGQPSPEGHTQTVGWNTSHLSVKTHLIFLWNRLVYLSWSFDMESRPLASHSSKNLLRCSFRMADATILLSLWFTTGHGHLLERSMYTHLACQFLQMLHRWHL